MKTTIDLHNHDGLRFKLVVNDSERLITRNPSNGLLEVPFDPPTIAVIGRGQEEVGSVVSLFKFDQVFGKDVLIGFDADDGHTFICPVSSIDRFEIDKGSTARRLSASLYTKQPVAATKPRTATATAVLIETCRCCFVWRAPHRSHVHDSIPQPLDSQATAS